MDRCDGGGGGRPAFPKRAVVTGGMPYGEKSLHFGHIGGMFVHADIYARFLRDRIGAENVLFVSGTDCYGAGVEKAYSALAESGAFAGTIGDFVRENHDRQAAALRLFGVEPDLYAASALDEAGEIHARLSAEVFEALHEGGYLRLAETLQFYDAKAGETLNGRQVTGRCPIQGCKSEIAYADECALGHQYAPDELIAPVSAISGEAPELRPVRNWYFDLVRFRDRLEAHRDGLERVETARRFLPSVIGEFLRPPCVYVKRESLEDALSAARAGGAAECEVQDEGKPSVGLAFRDLESRKAAVARLAAAGIRYRTGKALVPFRLTGNVEWGVPVPERYREGGRTFWVWPESLWAPISFTMACLIKRGLAGDAYRDWWMSDDARAYQFIGEDCIYFYSVAQTGLFAALDEAGGRGIGCFKGLRMTTVVPNRHLLYGKRKAASSGALKPPPVEALLEAYSKDQLRLHFFHMNLGAASVGFEPRPAGPCGAIQSTGANPNVGHCAGRLQGAQPPGGEYDPVVYEGNLTTNIYNRLIRSCFYSTQKHFPERPPELSPSEGAAREGEGAILAFERAMHRFEFNRAFEILDQYLRGANKRWAERSRAAASPEDWASLLADSFHAVRVALTLLHPMVPDGAELVREYLGADRSIWDWEHIFEPLPFFTRGGGRMRFLEPRVDFFAKPEGQFGGGA